MVQEKFGYFLFGLSWANFQDILYDVIVQFIT